MILWVGGPQGVYSGRMTFRQDVQPAGGFLPGGVLEEI